MFPEALLKQAEQLLARARERGIMLATAESCTGGLISALLTEIPGSSDVFERGFVTYSNAAKIGDLGVSAQLIAAHGAVSEAVAQAMAEGALKAAGSDAALAVTGVAGPAGGSVEKPVGMVCMAVAVVGKTVVQTHYFKGNRSEVRLQAVEAIFKLMPRAMN